MEVTIIVIIVYKMRQIAHLAIIIQFTFRTNACLNGKYLIINNLNYYQKNYKIF